MTDSSIAYFIGGPSDLSKQVIRGAPDIIRHAELQSIELQNMNMEHDLSVSVNYVLYRRRGQLGHQNGRAVYIYEVEQK